MEDYMMRQIKGSEILKSIMPIWKTHTLRWAYYRQIPNVFVTNPSSDKWISEKRCSNCKWGVNARIIFTFRDANDVYHSICKCPHCDVDYVAEPNTNFTHKIYKTAMFISKYFWAILDRLHLVRSGFGGRYDMMGDEARYVKSWIMDMTTGEMSHTLNKRKWWEYILIEKPFITFTLILLALGL